MGVFPKMVSTRLLLLLLWCVPVVSAACGATSVAELSSPTALRCQTSVAVPPGAVPAAGGTFTATGTAARECSWTAASDASWIQITPVNGLGASEITIVAASNPQVTARAASITVNDQRVAVSQEPMPCTFQLDRFEVDVPAQGGRVAVAVRTADGCPWSAAEAEPWLRLLRTSGTGAAAVDIEAEANTGDARTGAVQIAGHTVRVIQDRRPAPPPPAPAPSPAPPSPSDPSTPTPPAPLPPPPPDSDDVPDDDNDKGKDKGQGGGRR